MKIHALAIAAILSLPTPALALSCMNPSLIAWAELSRTSGDMAIVYGQLGTDAVFTGVEMRAGEPDIPVRFSVPEEQTRPHMGWVDGPAAPIRGLISPMPLDRPFVGPVFGRDKDARAFALGVCSPHYVTDPPPDLLAKIRTCLDTGLCTRN